MIKVLCDDKLIYDSRLPEYTITSGVVTREDNRAGSFVFAVQKSHPNYDHLERMTPTVYVYKDDDPEPMFKGRIINGVDDFYGGRKFTCEGELSFLIDSIQRPYAFADSPEEYFKYFIQNHNSDSHGKLPNSLQMVNECKKQMKYQINNLKLLKNHGNKIHETE